MAIHRNVCEAQSSAQTAALLVATQGILMAGSPTKRARKERTAAFIQNQEMVDDLLAEIAAGAYLREYCLRNDIVYSTVQQAITSGDQLPRYQAALDARSDLAREDIEILVGKVERGEIDPKAAAVAIGGKQWLAKVLNRRRYGDQSVVDVAVTDVTKLHIAALRELSRLPRKPKELMGRVIEGEYVALPLIGAVNP